MPDIENLLKFVASTPAEAAENIDDARAFDISPDSYKSLKPQLKPEVDALSKPTTATPAVTRYMAQSDEHAAVVSNDIDKLSWVEKRWKYLGDSINKIPTTERKLNDLAFKKTMNLDKFTVEDELMLDQHDYDLSQAESESGIGNFKDPNTPLIDKAVRGLGFLGGIGRSIYDSIAENKSIVAGGAAIGAGAGAVAGAPIGGVGAIPGAITGGISGGVYGTLTAMAYDGTVQQIGATGHMLGKLTDDEGNPLNIDADTKRNISVGVGVMTGALSFIGGRAAAQTVPFLQKYITRKGITEILHQGANKAAKQALVNIGKATAIGFAEGSGQEFISIVGEEVGKTYDGSEASFISGLNNAATTLLERKKIMVPSDNAGTKMIEDPNQPTNFERMLVGGIGNAISSGAFSAIGNGINYKLNADKINNADNVRFDNARDVSTPPQASSDLIPLKPKGDGGGAVVTPIDDAVDVLNVHTTIQEMAKATDETELKNVAPHEAAQIRKEIVKEAGITEIFVDKESLLAFANDEDKAAAVNDMLDEDGREQAATNAPIRVEPHKFLELVDKYPNAADLAKLKPEGPDAANAKKYLEEMAAAGEKRKEIFDQLGVAEGLTPENEATLKQALETEQPFRTYPSNEVFGEAEYLTQPSLMEAIKDVMPPGQAEAYSEAQRRARQTVADNIHETAVHEMNQIIDITTREAFDAEIASQFARLENNPNLALVDKFTKTFEMVPDNRFFDPEEMRANHAKKGFSPLAIDPRQLTEEQQKMFLENPQLAKHKVFVKGGISPDDSARLLGVSDGETLLKILASTPSREEVAKYRAKQREADVIENSRDSVDLNKTAIIQAYNDNTANHVAELKHMLEQEWPSARGGIRKIALPLPTKEGLRVRAQNTVGRTKIANLNVNQFKVGERKSQRLAVDAILKNEVEKAFVNKEAAALNSELTRATMIATGKVNRVLKFARKLDKPENVRELKDAGYYEAARELLDVFNLSSKDKSQSKKNSFKKYVETALRNGDVVVEIPEYLADVRQSFNEMTVEQAIAVGNALQSLLHQAKMKNKLYTKHEKIKALKTVEGLANALDRQTKEIQNEKNLVVLQKGAVSATEKVLGGVMQAGTILRRSQNLLVTLDNGNDSGLANDLFWQPIKDGNSQEMKMGAELAKQLELIVDKFGKKEFDDLRSDFVVVPEFKGISSLKDGRISKAELLVMSLNRGNEDNILALENFGVSRDVIKTVLEREFGDHKYMELTQRIWDLAKSYEGEIARVHKETTGVDVDFVQAEPIEFTDKNGDTRIYPGGYYNIRYLDDRVKNISEVLMGSAQANADDKFRQKFYSQAQTRQGHLQARTGSKKQLDLNIDGIGFQFAQTIHDIAMRIPIRDTAKLLADEKMREIVVKGIGQEGYSALADMVVSQVNAIDLRTRSSDAGGVLTNISNFFMGNFSAAHLLMKVGSIAIQTGSIPFVLDRIPSGPKHMASVLAKLPGNFKSMIAFAELHHTPLRDAREGLEGDIAYRLLEILPEKKWNKGIDWVRAGQKAITELGFGALQQMDNLNKIIAFHTAYASAMNGDVGYVQIGNHLEAVKYASNVTELMTTHASQRNLSQIQREKWVKPFTMFYNDMNVIFNHMSDRKVQTQLGYSGAYKDYKKGDRKGAFKRGSKATTGVLYTMMAIVAVKMLENAIRGKQVLPFNDNDDPEEMIKKSVKYFATTPFDMFIDTLPFARDINYTMDFEQLTGRKQKLEPVPLKIGNTLKDTITSLAVALDLSDEKRKLNEKDYKNFLYTTGYLTGIPSDSIYNYLIKPDWSKKTTTAKSEIAEVVEKIQAIITSSKDEATAEIPDGLTEEQLAALEADQASIPTEISPEALEELQRLQNELDPTGIEAPTIPEQELKDHMEAIKLIESDGKWYLQNPNSSAAGLYQFTEPTWKDLMKRAPELGLTENGRVSENTEQQEIAMKYFTEKNIEQLQQNGLEASIENVYAAHFLGAKGAIKVLPVDDDAKLEPLVGEQVMKANGFRKTMTVKNFKRWLSRKTSKAVMRVQDAKNASVDLVNN